MRSKKDQIEVSKDTKIKVVEASGFLISCQSPMEISLGEHFASNRFVDIVLEYRYQECLSAVMEATIEKKWRLSPFQALRPFLMELGFKSSECSEWLKFKKTPLRYCEKFAKLFLENPETYKDFIDP